MLWLKAPIIVKYNRERITLSYIREKKFAKLFNTFLVRWPSDDSKWKGKPSNHQIDELYENDPDFLEIFIYSDPCYLDDTICIRRKNCNGTRATYYSFVLHNESIEDYKNQV